MSSTIQKSFRLPEDVVRVLEQQPNSTDYLVDAIREKRRRDEEDRFRASARRIASLCPKERDVDFAIVAQSEVVFER